MIREDHGDMIYLTKQEKYDAIVSDIKECNKKPARPGWNHL